MTSASGPRRQDHLGSLAKQFEKIEAPKPKWVHKGGAHKSKHTRDHDLTMILQKYVQAAPGEKKKLLGDTFRSIKIYKEERGPQSKAKRACASFSMAFFGKSSSHLPEYERKTQLVDKIENVLASEVQLSVKLNHDETDEAVRDMESGKEQGADSASMVRVGERYVAKMQREEFSEEGGLVTVSPLQRQKIKESLILFTCGSKLIMPRSTVVQISSKDVFLEEKMNVNTSTSENMRIYLRATSKFNKAAEDLVKLSKFFVIGDITQAPTTESVNYLEPTSDKVPRWDNLPLLNDGGIAFFDTDQVRPRDEGEKNSVLDIIRFFPYNYDKIMHEADRLGLDVNPHAAAIVLKEAISYYRAFYSIEALKDKEPPIELFSLDSSASAIEGSIHKQLELNFPNLEGKSRSIDTFTEFRLENSKDEILTVLHEMQRDGKISAFQVKIDEFEESHCVISIVV